MALRLFLSWFFPPLSANKVMILISGPVPEKLTVFCASVSSRKSWRRMTKFIFILLMTRKQRMNKKLASRREKKIRRRLDNKSSFYFSDDVIASLVRMNWWNAVHIFKGVLQLSTPLWASKWFTTLNAGKKLMQILIKVGCMGVMRKVVIKDS